MTARALAALALAAPLALAAINLAACGDKDDDTGGSEETDADTDSDTDADTDSDTDTDPAYTSYEGWESYDWMAYTAMPGEDNCQLVWDAVGTPADACEGCDFAFEVSLTLQDEDYVYYDETCDWAVGDFVYTYAYAYNYYGYGYGWSLIDYYGYWYAWAYADFEGGTFTYSAGVVNYYYSNYYGYYPEYAGTYYTSYYYGQATVQ